MTSLNGKNGEMTDTEEKIVKQIEYYFGDINLAKDKFLKSETAKNNGWVPLSVLLTFNRLKALANSEEEIVAALRKSKSGLIAISENERQVKRDEEKFPMPEITDEYRQNLWKRTIHMKGFPLDANFEDIREYCSQFGELESLEVRRTKEKTFKGCVFATYKTIEEADKALNGDSKYKDSSLLRENKVQYFERRTKYFASKGKKLKIKQEPAEDGENDEDEAKVKPNLVLTQKAVLKLTNIPKEVGFEVYKAKFNEFGKVQFVDIDEKKAEAFVRYGDENGAEIALTKLKEKGETVDVGGSEVKFELVTGEEEASYWGRLSKIRSEHKNKIHRKGKGRKNNSRNAYRGQKRGAEEASEGAKKQIKTE